MSLPNITENNNDILSDISSLQQLEQDLFNTLETNTNLSQDQIVQTVNQINSLSSMRIELYQSLGSINSFYQDSLESSVGTLKEQANAIGIIESELNQSKKRLELLETDKNNKIRLIEINDYYGEKYAEHSQLMKLIIFTLIPVIIITILKKKEILPEKIYYILLIIIGIFGGYFFWIKYMSIITRDNMDYQEYDWYFDPNTGPPPATTTVTDDPWGSLPQPVCIGSDCCSSTEVYDSSLNQCVASTTTAPTTAAPTTATTTATPTATESFVSDSFVPDINQILTKKQPYKYKSDYNMNPRYEASSNNNFLII
jgi:hypothetical protein